MGIVLWWLTEALLKYYRCCCSTRVGLTCTLSGVGPPPYEYSGLAPGRLAAYFQLASQFLQDAGPYINQQNHTSLRHCGATEVSYREAKLGMLLALTNKCMKNVKKQFFQKNIPMKMSKNKIYPWLPS